VAADADCLDIVAFTESSLPIRFGGITLPFAENTTDCEYRMRYNLYLETCDIAVPTLDVGCVCVTVLRLRCR
jgi:hypothetical protein